MPLITDETYKGLFSLIDYNIVGKQLLLRRNLSGKRTLNLDLKFSGVAYYELPYTLTDLHLSNGEEQDWDYIRKRVDGIIEDQPLEQLRLYKIVSAGKPYYVLACGLDISKNRLEFLETSLSTVNKGTAPYVLTVQNKVEIIDQWYSGKFVLLDYHRSHSRLALRLASIHDGQCINLDIIFNGVHYSELPDTLSDAHIFNGNKEDWVYVNDRYNEAVTEGSLSRLFKIVSGNKSFFILSFFIQLQVSLVSPEVSTMERWSY